MPTDVAVDREGMVYVADGVNRRVVLFSADGQWADTIESVANRPLANPVGLTIDERGRLWIAENGHSALVVIDPGFRQSGEEGRWIDLPPSEDGRPCDPTDVAVTPGSDRIWLVDNDHHRLMFRDGEQGSWSAMGGAGTGLGQFQWPFMLTADAGGDLYVTEAIGARAQHLTSELRWTGQIGRWGIRPGELYRPKGVAVDSEKRVYISDSTMGVVQVFESDGRFLGVLSAEDGQPHRFDHPMGMTFDAQANLYVGEMNRHTVTKITLANAPATQPAPPSAEKEASE